MRRREILLAGLGVAAGAVCTPAAFNAQFATKSSACGWGEYRQLGPTRSLIPVVGDGRWVWTKPPEGQTGYLEPRPFELKVGIELTGRGNATGIQATTPVPVPLPEQQVERATVEKAGCLADFRRLAPQAGQLLLASPAIVKGQTIRAVATMRLTLSKSYHAFEKEQFPQQQPRISKQLASQYLHDSPGIQTRAGEVKDLANKIAGRMAHPWDKAYAFYKWVWENIRPQIGPYTSVLAAIDKRVGDCEERAAVFTALCRVSGIPARLVWVPNHNWAEFLVTDESGKGHWIPAHTSAYSWFGWTGVHELVLQKGDSIKIPEKRKPQRLMEDWMQWLGARPEARWFAELRPLPPNDDADAGPGARSKNERGEWVVAGTHKLDSYLRDGSQSAARDSYRRAPRR
jgi:hypothetical protein